jgi:3-oxoacyl-[acyl-carrier protein] reductase
MSLVLSDKVALVTGGSRGIGRETCIKLASLGATVIVNYASNSGAADQTVADILASGGKAEALGFNVADAKAVEEAIKTIIEKYSKVDILVNNAGIARDGLIVRTSEDDWQQTIQTNLSAAFYCSKAVAKSMMKARAGKIVNISSVIGETGNAGQVAYSASKAGLFGLTKSLARELASRNVNVNAVTPGYIQTDMTNELPESQREQLLSQIPLGRLGTTSDVAELIAFLCCPESSYITGQVFAVNGGMYM